MRKTLLALVFAVLALLWTSARGWAAQTPPAESCPRSDPACPVLEPGELEALRDAEPEPSGQLLFFWGVGCPHCDQAKPFVDRLADDYPSVTIERIEVKRDARGRERFIGVIQRLDITAPGVPAFVYGDHYVIGFVGETTERRVRGLLEGASNEEDRAHAGVDSVGLVELPVIGTVDPDAIPLPVFTALVGLVDGINPCAMWVLLVLLGVLTHVQKKSRMLLFGGIFVLMSGLVYFLFMTVWIGLFRLVGLSRTITIVIGVVVLAMGLVNLKELIWFKRGVSLVIPEKAKPTLFRRMRAIARAASLPAAVAAIAALAFLVNLIELGCTLGLPAVYTRILSLRADLSALARYGYVGLYNLAYVVPLALIVAVYTISYQRIVLSERGAKILKGISGALLVLFGALFIFAPEMLG